MSTAGASDLTLDALPTQRGIPLRPADFATLADALDYAALGETGFTYYAAKGQVAETLTYARMREEAEHTAGRLRALGLSKGDRVAIVADTDADFARAFLGALYAGLIPAPLPLPIAFGAREAYNEQLRRIITVAGASAVFAPEGLVDWVKEATAPLDLRFTGRVADLPEAAGGARHAPDPDDLAYLQFSSGTTGAPKGIAVTHRAMMANLQAIVRSGVDFTEEDRGVTWLPLYHDMGLVGCFLAPISAQMAADHMATKDFIRRPLLWLELISRNRTSITYAPSFGYDLALRRARGRSPEGMDLSSWRVAGIGGDMIKAPTLRAFAETFEGAKFNPKAFTPSYGMAETTLALSFSPMGQGLRTERLDLGKLEREMAAEPATGAGPARDFALCGEALPGHKIEIRDETGEVMPEGRVGRVFAAGPSLMREYFGDEAATAAALSDGWLDTGDLGFLRDGQIVITGRAKDLMIVHGRNLWPQDLEWTVENTVEHVRARGAAAFSVTPDDSGPRVEEEVVVVVECRARDAEAREAIRAEVHAAVREGHGVEARVALAPNGALPQTSSGKLSRARARIMYLDGAFDAGSTA